MGCPEVCPDSRLALAQGMPEAEMFKCYEVGCLHPNPQTCHSCAMWTLAKEGNRRAVFLSKGSAAVP